MTLIVLPFEIAEFCFWWENVISLRWLDIKYLQVFVNTIILSPAHHGFQISTLTVVRELGICRGLPLDPGVVEDIVFDVARQVVYQSVETVLRVDPIHCIVRISIIVPMEPFPDVVEAVDIMRVCESGDELLLAISKALGDADISVGIFAKDAHVVLCYRSG